LTSFEARKILFVGDRILNLLASSIGGDYLCVEERECSSIVEYIRGSIERYSIVIVSSEYIRKCRELERVFRELRGKLFVIEIPGIEDIKRISEDDIREYYEKLVRKYVGVRISL